MRALLLCAGTGSRLRPLTDVLPKCLMPINGVPLLGIWLDMLRRAGVSGIVVNVHHHADLIRDYVSGSPYSGLVTLATEPYLLGTGGTLLHHKAFFAGAPVLMAHADNLSVFDPREFLEAHRRRPPGAAMSMMTFVTPTPAASGVVECDSRGIVVAFHEKKREVHGNIANAAVYLIEATVFDYLESLRKPVIDFSTEVIPHFVGKIFTVHNSIYHRDIGTPMSLAQAQLEYPLFAPRTATSTPADPWFGLMARDQGRLAHAFASRLSDTFSVPQGDSGSTRQQV